jgi:hypothetical protein
VNVREVDGVQVFDLRGEPHQLARDEWTPHIERAPEDMRGAAVHAWGVKSVGTMGSMRARYGEAGALARRGLAVPYTISCGVTALGGVPVVSLAHPLQRYTYASDAGNAGFVSVGIMGLFAFEAGQTTMRHTVVTDTLRLAVDVALRMAVHLLDTFTMPERAPAPWALLAHRQCANGPRDHFACPGEAAIEMALGSKAVRDDLLIPDPDLVLLPQFGKAWPKAWRRHLLDQAQGQLKFEAGLGTDGLVGGEDQLVVTATPPSV